MLEQLPIADETIIARLRDRYGLAVTGLTFLPLGYDSQAGVYRVHAGGSDYFLKVKREPLDELSVRLPCYLKAQGIEAVVAPLPTVTRELWDRVENFTLILYPFIDGEVGMEVGLSDSQWIAFGAALKQIHTARLPADLRNQVPQETFTLHPKWRAIVAQLQATVGNRVYDNPVERQLAAFWADRHQAIDRLVVRAEQLGAMLQDKSGDWVLCHADIHTANLLIDSQGRLFIVDWDQPVLAPRERDLMFVMAGGFAPGERETALFFQGYGKTALDLPTLAYYCYARAVEDIGGFGERVFLMDVNDETKQDSVEWFRGMFEPGNIVEAAHQLDQAL